MDVNTVIVDNFLPYPDLVREQAIKLDYITTGQFPGVRSMATDNDYQQFVNARVTSILGISVDAWILDSFCFQLCYEGAKSWIHKDQADWAGVLYLTPNAPLDAGTGLYREDGNGGYELVTALGNVYNRLVLYRGDLFHSSMLPGFGNTPETGRLTQVFFFNSSQRPGGGWE
jgi:hypothetical protein